MLPIYEIENTDADEREYAAAQLTYEILHSLVEIEGYPDNLVIAAIGTVFRGNERLLQTKHLMQFLLCCRDFGIQKTWEAALFCGWFCHVDQPLLPNLRLDLNSMSATDCKNKFRFNQDQLKEILAHFPFPEIIIAEQRDRVHLIEAFCLVMRRLSYPVKWTDLKDEFGRHGSALCRIFFYMMRMLLSRTMPYILLLPTSVARLESYRQAFVEKGVPAELQIAFALDAKKHFSCRPTKGQRSQYSVHKKGHGFKYQTVESPDGLIIHCSRSSDGRRADPCILRDSNLLEVWRRHPVLRNGYRMVADSAYPNNDVVTLLYKKPRYGELAEHQRVLNSLLSPPRTSVEWGYLKIVTLWAFLDFKKQMMMLKSPIESFWHMSVWLTNLHTCVNGGNLISDYFGLSPPTAGEFLTMTLSGHDPVHHALVDNP